MPEKRWQPLWPSAHETGSGICYIPMTRTNLLLLRTQLPKQQAVPHWVTLTVHRAWNWHCSSPLPQGLWISLSASPNIGASSCPLPELTIWRKTLLAQSPGKWHWECPSDPPSTQASPSKTWHSTQQILSKEKWKSWNKRFCQSVSFQSRMLLWKASRWQ